MDEPYWQDTTKLKGDIPDIVAAFEEEEDYNAVGTEAYNKPYNKPKQSASDRYRKSTKHHY